MHIECPGCPTWISRQGSLGSQCAYRSQRFFWLKLRICCLYGIKIIWSVRQGFSTKKIWISKSLVFQYNLMNPLFTFGQFEVRCQSLFIGWLQKQLALWNVSKQELNHCTQLVHGMPKSNGRGWSFSQGLHQVFMGFGVIQLNSYKWE